MRIVSWNIRAGGGTRVEGILAQIECWSPDLVCLCEFRATPPSARLAAALGEAGYEHQQTTSDVAFSGSNALLIASRFPLQRLLLRAAPTEPRRWLAVRLGSPQPIALALMHVPNFVTRRKPAYLAAVDLIASRWRHGPAVFIGDTNCGWPGIDEENPAFGRLEHEWLESMSRRGWRDAFRYLHAEERIFTWYSPNAGNGFRLDQAFVNRRLLSRLQDVSYQWGGVDTTRPRGWLSDHAALILDLRDAEPESTSPILRTAFIRSEPDA